MPIVTADNWKTYRGYTGTDYDTTVTALIPAVQAEMERYCGRLFDEADRTEVLDGTGTDTIYLRHAPIIAVDSVSVGAGTGASVLDSTAYEIDADAGALVYASSGSSPFGLRTNEAGWPDSVGPSRCWTPGRRNVSVTYTAGYGGGGGSSVAVPEDLKLAAYALIDLRLWQRGRPLILTQAAATGTVNTTYANAAEAEARYFSLIGPFVREVR